MDRPLSAASSTTASTAPAHRRNASIKHTSRLPGPSIVQLFFTNLRLLNLDLLSDWPAITATSFTTQDARSRIKSTEYVLYQLFRLYDPSTTADKLQPFFPPLEPLQSVNLRAALYRCLNDLKKNGVLPKDTLFRKSMLDDCQGDKFWEACLSFSAVVLRKITLERKAKHGRPVAEKLGTAPSLSKRSRESMLPLALAHKAALSKVLKERERKRETCARLHDVLCDKEAELQQRKTNSLQEAQKTKTLPREKTKVIEDAVTKNWVGSVELKDALIAGDTCAQGDGILVETFDQLWKQNGEQGIAVSNGADVGLLQSLSSRATQQSVRLRMWQNYLDRLMATKPQSRGSLASSKSQKPAVRFDRHRGINLKAPTSEEEEEEEEEDGSPSPSPPPPERRHVSASRYDEILTAMREELRKNSGHRSVSQPTASSVISPLKRAQTQPMPNRRPSMSLDTSSGAQDQNIRIPSHTSVPMRPRMGRRVSSQSKTYEKPKVDSQREFIPLKAELFSPLKENRRSNLSFTAAASGLAAAVEEPETLDSDAVDAVAKRSSRGITLMDDIDSGVDLRSGNDFRESETNTMSSARSSKSVDDLTESITHAEAEFKIPTRPLPSHGVRPSLSERTRMSIAFNSSEDTPGFLSDGDSGVTDAGGGQSKDAERSLPEATPPSLAPRASLLERTRESILQAPPSQDPVKSKKYSHTRSRSSLHPVNQFETPRKARSSTIGAQDHARRDATPVEQLMSPDAEYESVFKSRPRIALSPILSPRQDDGDVHDHEALGADAAAGSSPLASVGLRATKSYE